MIAVQRDAKFLSAHVPPVPLFLAAQQISFSQSNQIEAMIEH